MHPSGQPPESPTVQGPKAPHLKDYLNVIQTRKWILISTFLVIVLCTAVYVHVKAPVYRASLQLEFKPSNLNLIPSEEVVPTPDMVGGPSAFQSFLETQYELILSPTIVKKTFQRFGLKEEPEFRELTAPEEVFVKLFDVKPVKDTWLANVTFEWKDPESSVRILDFLVNEYLDGYNSSRRQDTYKALEDLEKDAEEIRHSLQAKNEQLQKFLEDNGILSLEKEQDIVLRRLLQLNESLTEAEQEAIKARSRYSDIARMIEKSKEPGNENILENIPEVLENQSVRELKTELLRTDMLLNDLRQKGFGSRHPEILSAEASRQVIELSLEMEKKSIISSLEREYERAIEQEETLRLQLEAQQLKVAELNRKTGEYKLLMQEYETTKETYDTRNKRISEIRTFLAASSTNIAIAALAAVSPRPVKPKKILGMILACVVGLMLGLGLCFFVEYLDTTLKTKDDVERILETPVLGFVPPVKPAPGAANGRVFPELAAVDRPHSVLSEAFRSIRTALLFSHAGSELRKILVTSPMPSEGKTLVSVNVALALAQADKRVLLVDADMRKPRLAGILDLPSEPGLSNILAAEGVSTIEDALAATDIRNLTFLPSGPHPPNSSELLGADRMSDLVGRLSGMFDYVIFDSPPAFNAADAATLCRYMDGIVLVVRSFATERDVALRARDILRNAQGNILGTILNNADVPRGSYYGYGRAYYRYHSDDSYGGDGYGEEKPEQQDRKASPAAGKNDARETKSRAPAAN
jgi:capsular exopolysaccharide synthesis family protein